MRASGLPYTIVRPGWFDYNKPDEHRLVFLVASLTSNGALRKSFELVATKGPAPYDLEAEFARLDADPSFPEHGQLRLSLEGGR